MNGLKVLMLLMMIMRNLLLVPNGKIERFVCANFFDIKKVENGRTPQLSGSVGAFHPADPDSNPKHTMYTYQFLCHVKRTTINKKRSGLAHIEKRMQKKQLKYFSKMTQKNKFLSFENIRRFVRLKFNGLIGQNCKSVSNLYLDWLK